MTSLSFFFFLVWSIQHVRGVKWYMILNGGISFLYWSNQFFLITTFGETAFLIDSDVSPLLFSFSCMVYTARERCEMVHDSSWWHIISVLIKSVFSNNYLWWDGLLNWQWCVTSPFFFFLYGLYSTWEVWNGTWFFMVAYHFCIDQISFLKKSPLVRRPS